MASNLIPDEQITATSINGIDFAYLGRLNNRGKNWCPVLYDNNPVLKVGYL